MNETGSITELRNTLRPWRQHGERVAFVPTMGNLHRGHVELVRHARDGAQRVVVSVFVNPLQFGPAEDYDGYPRTLDNDRAKLQSAGVDLLFVPEAKAMYPTPLAQMSKIHVPMLSDILCGASRPGHFEGVATVVAKLFHLVQPDVAFFGEKDFQQLLVIQRMARDLDFPVEVIGVPTVREDDGLAMSSRNSYLTAEQRRAAPTMYRTLTELKARLDAGERDYAALARDGQRALKSAGLVPDYVAVRRAENLTPPTAKDADLVILAAAWLGKARLIDNLRVRV